MLFLRIPKPQSVPEPSKPEKNNPPLMALEDIAGIYFNPAYGSISLCTYSVNITGPTFDGRCGSMLSEFAEAWSGEPPSFVATWEKYWSTHMILQHSDGDRFTIRSGILSPPPFLEDKKSKPFIVEFGGMKGSAKFIYSRVSHKGLKVDGFAVKGLWGAGLHAKQLDGEDKDSAEIWFDRVDYWAT